MKHLIGVGLLIVSAFGIAFCSKDKFSEGGSNTEVTVDYHQSAVTQWVTAGGTKFAYRVLGDKGGVPLVLVPALGNSMDDWDPAVTNGLAKHYKVIIFDLPGV